MVEAMWIIASHRACKAAYLFCLGSMAEAQHHAVCLWAARPADARCPLHGLQCEHPSLPPHVHLHTRGNHMFPPP